MKLKIYYNEKLEYSSNKYFEDYKKYKKKILGATSALEKIKKDIAKFKNKVVKVKQKQNKQLSEKTHWFEKYKWSITRFGNLIVAGKDATTNEIIIKKYTDEKDVVFHTTIAGSPFGVIKYNENHPLFSDEKKYNELNDNEKKEVLEDMGEYIASNSKAWSMGITSLEVFHVNLSQVSKEAKAGEYLSKGSFMIYGKKNLLKSEIKIGVGIYKLKEEELVICGSEKVIKKFCSKYYIIVPGKTKKSDFAKRLSKEWNYDLDTILRQLPPDNIAIIEKK